MLNSTTTTFSSAADLLAVISDVDVLIDETFIGSNLTAFLENYQIKEADQSKYKFLANKKVYREDGILTATGGYDWFGAPVAMADALLQDMINAVNPSAPSDNYSRNWMRNIALGEPIKFITADNCSWSEDTPRPNLATEYTGGKFTLSSTSDVRSVFLTKNMVGAMAVSLATLVYLV